MEILIVEDETRVAEFLQKSLSSEGHSISVCHGLEEADSYLSLPTSAPEAAILDRMLNGADGLDLLPRLKHSFPNCRILILSAVDLPDEKARALDKGADDYLSKPFSLVELTARIRALTRRHQSSTKVLPILVKDLSIDITSQNVSVAGKRLDLSRKEFQVLSLLSRHPGRVFNKFQLLDQIWDVQAGIESNTVEVTILNLRKKLRELDSAVEILSKRNVGYWIEA